MQPWTASGRAADPAAEHLPPARRQPPPSRTFHSPCAASSASFRTPVNQLIYDALLLLQHRGQDAAGIVTMRGTQVLHAQGARHGARRLPHPQHARCRAAWAWAVRATRPRQRLQPGGGAAVLRQRAPFGIVLVHNGNLTNAPLCAEEAVRRRPRHINTESDTEVLINVCWPPTSSRLAARTCRWTPDAIFAPSRRAPPHQGLVRRRRADRGHGLLAFRDPFGIRPLCFGDGGPDAGEVMVASESVALEGHRPPPGARRRAGRGDLRRPRGRCTRQCADRPALHPCIFEYVYLARPDSVLDGISVYQAR